MESPCFFTPQPDPDGLVLGLSKGQDAVAVAEILEGVLAIVEALQLGANHALRVVLHTRHHAQYDVDAVLLGDLLHSDCATEVGGKLGTEVATALLRGAHIGEYDGVDVVVEAALGVETHTGEAQALSVNLGGGAVAAGAGTADIGPVGADACVAQQHLVIEVNGGDHIHIR